ncbi:TonB-dependent receptor [Brevundimonas naejangsanensis]|uniref:TonB-dependent receptor n=1 Tax=Brevundimonas naejangsanensis TaxID=588932 RepID=A0A494RFX5_9CAUL|nr:TonB-dependent receptor [Brevundimonas naejangsanensis]AYG94023.1 TonB-dependent receptor [Brevundimonas naejangsanensis]
MHLKRKYLFGTTVLAGVIAVSAPAFAQERATPVAPVPVDGQTTEVGEIVVTGSRIRRDPVNAPTPLIQVSQEQLMETGLTSVIDYLATIPALSNSLVPSDTTGSLNIAGVSAANLRSLGTDRVLTLIDGRRQVGAQVGRLLVDVDTIPRLLIQNIEIITGGASSVYGADAVSGVLNYNLRKDFDGLEIDANAGQIAGDDTDAPMTRRISGLIGKNFFDDRLNLYAFAEYEKVDEVQGEDIAWLRDGRTVVAVDADPTNALIGPATDGIYDNALFYDVRYVGRPRWGVTNIANSQRPSPTTNPLIPLANCTSYTVAACYAIDPAKTYWYENGQARLVNLGTRIGAVGTNRPYNIGGDGDNANTTFGGFSRTPESESSRFQVGANFKVTDNVTAYVEAKYVDEQSFIVTQPSFFDVYISDTWANDAVQPLLGSSAFTTRIDDNAFLPAVIRAALQNNQVDTYGSPTPTTPGAVTSTVTRNYARHQAFGINRSQENSRQVQRYVAALKGNYDQVGFIRNFGWDLSYTFGQLDNYNKETGMDILRTALALDAVVDTAGLVSGKPGQIVCRAQLLAAQGRPVDNWSGNLDDKREFLSKTDPEVAQCAPLNVFGAGNQSAEAIDFITASIFLDERNRQQNFIASQSGQLWDFWGAGPLGYAVGVEWRKEEAQGLGRTNSTAGRYLQLNTGGDFLPSSYDSNEAFAEISVPLLRDSFLGEYAELSASYRYFDYSQAGSGDVYGVNLVYRPVQDITFKTSFNTSFRSPNLAETNAPLTQTFANGFVDPCDTRQITSAARKGDERANRIANCEALAAAKGLSFNWTDVTAANAYLPTYSSGIAGVNGGNPELKPETSESFTFSTVFQPRFVPNFSMVLDYYEIKIESVIQSVSAQILANQCVDGPALDVFACSRIFRETGAADAVDSFKVGRPSGDPVGGFIQVPLNYARREVRGLDFKGRYGFETADLIGHDLGSITWDLGGSWLIEQKNYNSFTSPDFFVESASALYYPRVRLTNRITWQPNADLSMTWTTDWQTSQNIIFQRDFISGGNTDSRPASALDTGNFARNDFSVRYSVNDEVTVRAGVTNVFNKAQNPWLGDALYSNFDPYGRRFYIGVNYRPW